MAKTKCGSDWPPRRHGRRRRRTLEADDVSPQKYSTFVLLFLGSLCRCARAEDAGDGNGTSSSSGTSQQQSDQSGTGKSSNKSKTGRPKGSLNVQSFCRNDPIRVSFMSLTCDSPGAYYYGSNTYRNSKVCMTNDKATVTVYCKFNCDLAQSKAGRWYYFEGTAQ